jgi:hypothetical protein
MTFEDAIAALGAEFGVALSDEDGTASFEVASEDGDFEPVNVTLTYEPEDETLLVSADAGAVDLEDGDEPLLRMLEANHMFTGTAGASFCLDDGRAKLQRRIRLDAFWREGGKAILTSLFKSVQDWRQRREE